jgi:hypothetical protein
MLNIENIYRMKDSSVVAIYKIIKRRLETEVLKPEVEALFMINLDILQLEMDKRGLSA